MRFAAQGAGVQDVDYAVTLLRRDLKKKSPEELTESKAETYFGTDLRKSHPLLYVVETRPADTSPAAATGTNGTNGAAPTTRQPAPGDTQANARDMSQDAYQALLKKHGLTNPSFGMPT